MSKPLFLTLFLILFSNYSIAGDLTVQQWAMDEADVSLNQDLYSRKSCQQIWAEIRQLHGKTYSHYPEFWSNPIAVAAAPVGLMYSSTAYFGYGVASGMEIKNNFKQARINHRLNALRTASAQKQCFLR